MLSETRGMLSGRITLGTLAVGAALSLTACGPLPLLPPALSGDSADESPSPEPEPTETEEEPEPEPTDTQEPEPEPVDPEDTDVFSLRVGDCLNEMESNPDETISEVPIVDCEEPHDFEVYHAGDLDGDDAFPGEEEVADLAAEECHAEFEDFVGTDYESSSLDFTTLFPTQEGWEDFDDREVLCLILDPAGQTTGTLEDARF